MPEPNIFEMAIETAGVNIARKVFKESEEQTISTKKSVVELAMLTRLYFMPCHSGAVVTFFLS